MERSDYRIFDLGDGGMACWDKEIILDDRGYYTHEVGTYAVVGVVE